MSVYLVAEKKQFNVTGVIDNQLTLWPTYVTVATYYQLRQLWPPIRCMSFWCRENVRPGVHFTFTSPVLLQLSNDIWRRTCLRHRTDGVADLVSFSVYWTCRLFCMLRVLAVFGLNATLIFSLIIIIIILITYFSTAYRTVRTSRMLLHVSCRALHWLLLSGMALAYLAADCQLSSEEGRHQLRSADSRTCVVRRTSSNFGDRCFAAAGPRL